MAAVPPDHGDEDEPRWMRYLEPFRSEEAAFRVLLYAIAIFVVATAAVLIARAVF